MTAYLGGHVFLVTAELRHLDLPLVAGAVPHSEADRPRVRLCGAQVNVGCQ